MAAIMTTTDIVDIAFQAFMLLTLLVGGWMIGSYVMCDIRERRQAKRSAMRVLSPLPRHVRRLPRSSSVSGPRRTSAARSREHEVEAVR